VDYAAARAAFFQAPDVDPTAPAVVAAATAARSLRDAAEPVAMHAVWSRRVNEALAEHGLDFLSSYVWGRAATLGEAAPGVVAATFAWFEPSLVTTQYEQGRSLLPRPRLLAIRTKQSIAGLAELLDGQEVAPVAEVLKRALGAIDGTGRPLFAGLRGLGWPTEPAGQLWRACDLIREYRGDGHVAAVVPTGLSPVEMNVLTELWLGMPMLSYSATRGWSEQQLGAAAAALETRGWLAGESLTEAGHRGRQEIEDRTDAAERPLIDAIGADLPPVTESLNLWGQLCIDAGAFPPDPFKRWAG